MGGGSQSKGTLGRVGCGREEYEQRNNIVKRWKCKEKRREPQVTRGGSPKEDKMGMEGKLLSIRGVLRFSF